MSLKEIVAHKINYLDETELQQVDKYLAFLKFQRRNSQRPSYDETTVAALYAEFAEEDRALAAQGMTDFARALEAEDAA